MNENFMKKRKLQECIILANIVGGISVQYPGCYQITEKEVLDAMRSR